MPTLQRNLCLSSKYTYFSYLQLDSNCVSDIICTDMLYDPLFMLKTTAQSRQDVSPIATVEG